MDPNDSNLIFITDVTAGGRRLLFSIKNAGKKGFHGTYVLELKPERL
jgi:hypothetical protein